MSVAVYKSFSPCGLKLLMYVGKTKGDNEHSDLNNSVPLTNFRCTGGIVERGREREYDL